MNAIQIEQTALPSDRAMSAPVLRTLLICDLAESTAMVEQLGDQRAAELMRRHDRLTRDLLQRHGGREIDKTDGFLLLFDRPVHAVAFALEYQRQLRELGRAQSPPLAARIGIHVGDVVLWDNEANDIARGAKPVEVEGIVKPTAARLMAIARPGQILLSGIAHTLALRARSELGEEYILRWRAHGNYRFKGVPEPVQVYEVGEDGIAPFKAPAWSGKAHREIPWWRRPGTLAFEAIAAALIIAVPVYFSLRSPPAIAFAKRDWVVVGDFKNLTGESVFDESLQTAFRLGLEESRHVNVLSDLKVRDAVERMQRKPDLTKIDRAVGSEIAIREGARALILPSLAEVGGHVRVTAEVIDPNTQTTVYSESSDGVGVESVLPSIDKVNRNLRVRLGEALATVSNESQPLEKVATANLDALRAYSLGLQAFAHSHDADALSLFQQAVKLDPDFALAYIGIARTYYGNDDVAGAKPYMDKAAALKDRLSPRNKLYLDAWLAGFGPPGPLLEKWALLGKLYPDYYAASYNYAFFSWQMENRAADAITAIQPALSEHDPLRAIAYYTLAYLQAAENQFGAALKNFETAASLGDSEQGIFYADTFAAQRDFAQANKVLGQSKAKGVASQDVFLPLPRIAIEADQAHVQAGMDIITEKISDAAKVDARYGRVFRAMQLSFGDYLSPRATQLGALRDYLADARKAMDHPAATNRDDDIFAVLFGAYLAARADDKALAKSALDAALPNARGSGYPNVEHMLAIVDAELSVRNDRPQEAVARLLPTRDGKELYLTHVALADALTAAGRFDEAMVEAKWLTEHRGRAYLEINSFHLLQARNVVESNLALLRMAELEHLLGHDEASQKHLAAFNTAWPIQDQPGFVTSRIKNLEARPHLASRQNTF